MAVLHILARQFESIVSRHAHSSTSISLQYRVLSSSNHSFSAVSLLKGNDLLPVLGSLRACLLTFIALICEVEEVVAVHLDGIVVIAAVVGFGHLVEYHEGVFHAILLPIVYIFL